MTFDVEPQYGTFFHVSSHLAGRPRFIFGGICMRESPRPYANCINWSLCGYCIKSADLYIIFILKFRMICALISCDGVLASWVPTMEVDDELKSIQHMQLMFR